MSHLIDANYEQLFLLPPALEDWLPMDDPARFIRVFVDAMDLEKLHLSQQTEGAGRPPYSNSLMLKIWLYCRLHNFMSSRNMRKPVIVISA
jgi:transposase